MEAENSESGGVFAHSGSGTVTTGLCISIVVSTHNIDTYVNVSYLYIYIYIYISASWPFAAGAGAMAWRWLEDGGQTWANQGLDAEPFGEKMWKTVRLISKIHIKRDFMFQQGFIFP